MKPNPTEHLKIRSTGSFTPIPNHLYKHNENKKDISTLLISGYRSRQNKWGLKK